MPSVLEGGIGGDAERRKRLMNVNTPALAALAPRKRNVPVRYDRDMVTKTLAAMERVDVIRAKRERRFFRERMKGKRARQLEADRRLVRENQHLLPPAERDRVEDLLREVDVVRDEAGVEAEGVEGMEEDDELDVESEELGESENEWAGLDEDEEEEKETPSKAQDLAEKEEAARKAARETAKPSPTAAKKKKTKVIVGHRPEKMDLDG